jgi:hypothetical protein
MPSVKMDDTVRVVVDETSFNFRGLATSRIEEMLDRFNDTLASLRNSGITAWKPPMFDAVRCTDDYELYEFLMGDSGREIDRDTKVLFFSWLINKCPEWDASIPGSPEVMLADGGRIIALSIAFALTLVLRNRGVACLTLSACERRGYVDVHTDSGSAELFFFAEAASLKTFWRRLYVLEDVPEAGFLTLAELAFPDLVFNPDLSFRRFDGSYRDLRAQVVMHLSVLNDDFLNAYHTRSGIARDIEIALAAIGCPGISPESPNTHRNEKVMRLRDVAYNGSIIRCEWHTKLEPHRNRIHFAFGDPFADKIFIGIFVDHLDT